MPNSVAYSQGLHCMSKKSAKFMLGLIQFESREPKYIYIHLLLCNSSHPVHQELHCVSGSAPMFCYMLFKMPVSEYQL